MSVTFDCPEQVGEAGEPEPSGVPYLGRHLGSTRCCAALNPGPVGPWPAPGNCCVQWTQVTGVLGSGPGAATQMCSQRAPAPQEGMCRESPGQGGHCRDAPSGYPQPAPPPRPWPSAHQRWQGPFMRGHRGYRCRGCQGSSRAPVVMAGLCSQVAS